MRGGPGAEGGRAAVARVLGLVSRAGRQAALAAALQQRRGSAAHPHGTAAARQGGEVCICIASVVGGGRIRAASVRAGKYHPIQAGHPDRCRRCPCKPLCLALHCRDTPFCLWRHRGTAAYQPPEMVHSRVVDARDADVWAMGCILYELVTGKCSTSAFRKGQWAVGCNVEDMHVHTLFSCGPSGRRSQAAARPTCHLLGLSLALGLPASLPVFRPAAHVPLLPQCTTPKKHACTSHLHAKHGRHGVLF